MNYRRQGLKVLGLSLLAALGLMAFTAAGAQASGSFLILKEDGGLLPTPWTSTIEGNVENALEGAFVILKLNLVLTCHKGSASGKISDNGHGHAAISFSECDVLDSEGKAVSCELLEPIKANALALVILHATDNKPYLLLSPLDGLTFAIIQHHDELCPLPESASVKGSVVAKIAEPDKHNVIHLISTKAMLELFLTHKLTYGSHEAHLRADATVGLTGDHIGLPWGAV